MQKFLMFSQQIIEQIAIYVYGLKDPRTNQYFYVGKGTGNRVYQHLASDQADSETEPRVETIREIRKAGFEPTFDVFRWGLSDSQEPIAFAIEAAIIDALNVDQLSNSVRGHGRGVGYGMLSEREVKEKFQGTKFCSNESFIGFKINKRWRWSPELTPEELYEATRKMWRVGPRRDQADYALAVSFGIVREVYKITHFNSESKWEPFTHTREVEKLKRVKWGFVGQVSNDLQHLVNTTVDHLPNATTRSPFFYLNC